MDIQYIITTNKQENNQFDIIALGLNILFSYVEVIKGLQSGNYYIEDWKNALAIKAQQINKFLKCIKYHVEQDYLKTVYDNLIALHNNRSV